jgi:hypothetical protein
VLRLHLLCLLQLLPSKRSSHVKALVQQLAAWATDDSNSSDNATQQQQQPQQLSRVQQLMQLPLDCEEEAALLGWFRQSMGAGQSGGHVLPLYLLQVRLDGSIHGVIIINPCKPYHFGIGTAPHPLGRWRVD